MKTSALNFFIGLTAFLIVITGFYLIYTVEHNPSVELSGTDSVSKFVIERDSVNGKLNKSTSSNSRTVTHSTPAKTQFYKFYSDEFVKNQYDLAYKLIYTGLFLLLFLALLPSLQNFNILGLFSATFRDRISAMQQINNDAEQTLATKPIQPPEQEKATDDPQKGKWGGKDERNNRKLTGTVAPDTKYPGLYIIQLKVITTDVDKPLTGKVKFHLHPTFINPNPEIFVVDGAASLRLRAYGSFTVGAEADNGETKLELDLATLQEADERFKKT